MERRERNKLSASERCVLITAWAGEAVAHIDSLPDYRRRLLEKTTLAMTVDGSGEYPINMEGHSGP